MLARSVVAAVSDRRRRSEIGATIREGEGGGEGSQEPLSYIGKSGKIRHEQRVGRGDVGGLCLEAYEVQSPEMETAAKSSQQPGTESCVMTGNGHCEA